jgi:prepilin-type N-terminal cleavage/methylation domain-containing protein
MKTNYQSDERWMMSNRQKAPSRSHHSLHITHHFAFTLVELLTVIAIIAILAALLLPVLEIAKQHVKKVQAQLEVNQIENAIVQYDSTYSRFPVSAEVQNQANNNGRAPKSPNGDFTYGLTINGTPYGTLVNGSVVTNAEVIAILMNLTNYPDGTPTINTNYEKNPQQIIFLSAKMSGYDPSTPGQPPGGVDITGTYRDPWGNPYLITMDLNYDGECQDAVYENHTVSQISPPKGVTGYFGLSSPDINPPFGPDNFQYHGKVMVWSAGPDGKISETGTAALDQANAGVNKDNILSW